jgi:hypothetical protein
LSDALLRHLLATLAYRAAKVLREIPVDFPTFSVSATTRPPTRIVAHMADLMTWGLTVADGNPIWQAAGGDDWDTEVRRFFDGLQQLDDRLTAPVSEDAARTLIAGPVADALTHVGQLAMLRGLAGAPIRPESYARAEIVAGRVGPEQATPVREFDGDASKS